MGVISALSRLWFLDIRISAVSPIHYICCRWIAKRNVCILTSKRDTYRSHSFCISLASSVGAFLFTFNTFTTLLTGLRAIRIYMLSTFTCIYYVYYYMASSNEALYTIQHTHMSWLISFSEYKTDCHVHI